MFVTYVRTLIFSKRILILVLLYERMYVRTYDNNMNSERKNNNAQFSHWDER